MGWIDRRVARVLDGTGVALSGSPEAETAEFVIDVMNPGKAAAMILAPEYRIPDGYVKGHWRLEKGDLGDFARHMMDRSGSGLLSKFTSQKSRPLSIKHLWKHWVTPIRATRAVQSHYDIDDRIYQLILDEEMVYTAAFFEEATNLYDAQQAKMAKIVERLRIPQGARVLDIGCGWGSLARHIVRARPDVHVTGITISPGQLDFALAHNAAALTEDQKGRVDLRLQDMRTYEPERPFDAVMSVGVFEHVGRSLYTEFFDTCARLCAPEGRILVHTILKNRSGIATNSWIDRYIFPGGYIASLAEIAEASEGAALDMLASHLHGPMNYGNTCRAWRRNLTRNRAAIMDIYRTDHGLSEAEAERGFRTWEIYLAGAEAGFLTRTRPMQTAQLVFRRTGVQGAQVLDQPADLSIVAE